MSLIFGKFIFKIFSDFTQFQKNGPICRSLSLFKKKNNIKETTPYIIVRANKDDYDEILKIMHENYYGEEPTVSSLNVPPNPVLDDRVIKVLTEGYTLVAKCRHRGDIVGACINGSTSPWDPDLEEKLACTIQSENVRKLIMFYAYLMRTPDLWRCLGVQKVYDMTYLFVKRSHRKKGIAFRLVQDSKDLGADAGFPVIRCEATSIHTAKICEKLGMQKVAEIPYCTYLDQNLEPVFKPPWPHKSVQIYCDCSPQHNAIKKKIKEKSSIFRLRK